MNMKCDEINGLLSMYLDNALSDSEHELISNHLKKCEKCSRDLALLQKTSLLIKELYKVKTPDGFAQRIKSRIHQEEKQSFWDFLALRNTAQFSLARNIVFISAVLVIVVVAGLWLIQNQENNASKIAQAPPAEMQAREAPKKLAQAKPEKKGELSLKSKDAIDNGRRSNEEKMAGGETSTIDTSSAGEGKNMEFTNKSAPAEGSLSETEKSASPATAEPMPPPQTGYVTADKVEQIRAQPAESVRHEAQDQNKLASKENELFDKKAKEETALQPGTEREKMQESKTAQPAGELAKRETDEELAPTGTGYPAIEAGAKQDETASGKMEQRKAGKPVDQPAAQAPTALPRLRAVKRLDAVSYSQLENLSKEEITIPIAYNKTQPRELIMSLLFDETGKVNAVTIINDLGDDNLEKNIIENVKKFHWIELLAKYDIPAGNYKMKFMLDENGLHLKEIIP
ncbi:MAG: hypothetical protein A2Y62_21860 [Candidatus Fischerbacteria bacterium RBG_13_37_8]|uniref:Putative zinc-finger domain-containing protein n=1 Tax=Candidatus Fischerbacteria bacterium RBG_13_37_8 TaxID=1817863 RepID=A0A1F5VTZ3_9BACT|nr:MAG: hypothetical protein A2Y62_21860 [Candidatus Fischerbacteria bacterium RBG_13_37_8]